MEPMEVVKENEPTQVVLRCCVGLSSEVKQLEGKELTYETLRASIAQLYPNLPPEISIKYRDEDGEMITIGCEPDLREALKWTTQRNKNTLYLFIMSKESDKNVLHAITNLFLNLSLEDKPLKTHLLMNGSEWNGVCKYENGEWFPFVLRVSKAEKNTVEGTIHWTTLNAVTRFLGIITKNYFKFREYEAIRGEDAVDLPANYKGLISSESKITEGTILGQKASFTLEFMGINTLKDDHQGAFKKLVGNSEYWYDRTKKGELEPRPKEQDKDKVRKSCPVCGMPMFERALDSDPTKTIEACATYPFCKPRPDYYYYYSDDDDDYF